jgi:hypothetical protein
MAHAIHQVKSFEIKAPFILNIRFEDNTEQTINFQPILAGEIFGPLKDLSVFNQVTIDPEVHTLVWPNGADFDPETLHNWPKYEGELIARALNQSTASSHAAGRVLSARLANPEQACEFQIEVSE